MARGKLWGRVERARDLAALHSSKIMRAMIKAAEEGDTKAAMWLLEHTEVTDDETGTTIRPIASTADLPKIAAPDPNGNAPRIMIGVSLGNDFAQLAPGAESKRLNAQPAALSPTTPHDLSHRVSGAGRPLDIANVIDAVPVLTSQVASVEDV